MAIKFSKYIFLFSLLLTSCDSNNDLIWPENVDEDLIGLKDAINNYKLYDLQKDGWHKYEVSFFDEEEKIATLENYAYIYFFQDNIVRDYKYYFATVNGVYKEKGEYNFNNEIYTYLKKECYYVGDRYQITYYYSNNDLDYIEGDTYIDYFSGLSNKVHDYEVYQDPFSLLHYGYEYTKRGHDLLLAFDGKFETSLSNDILSILVEDSGSTIRFNYLNVSDYLDNVSIEGDVKVKGDDYLYTKEYKFSISRIKESEVPPFEHFKVYRDDMITSGDTSMKNDENLFFRTNSLFSFWL